MPDILVNDLKKLKEYNMKHQYQFTQNILSLVILTFFIQMYLEYIKINMLKKVEVKQIRLHDFRYSCASLLINKGVNIQVVAKYLGHTKIE